MNRLQHETSPYLLQHAHNPVDWYAWKPEAFEKAKRENKPILVSIGYSTCHWCHVMERESFEQPDVAEIMNAFFINIKVDREERPDLDQIYMEACQILTGGGGWPLNCFLLPDGRPFYAGTYYPPRPAHNRPSWPQLLNHIHRIYREKHEEVIQQAEQLTTAIQNSDTTFYREDSRLGLKKDNDFSTVLHDNIFEQLQARFDKEDGGFGGAPKFPGTMSMEYLLEYFYHTRNHTALNHVAFSLQKMIRGGIYDQLGGGFARYTVDKAWLVPHFEKMLYDNALLVSLLSNMYLVTEEALYKETIIETLDFIEREMMSPEGGFYSALDADSEGEEGKFYIWDKSEIETHLEAEEAAIFSDYYGISEAGNWEGNNILWRPNSLSAVGIKYNYSSENIKSILAKAGKKLFEQRAKRVRPGLDDKILLNWNALQLKAYIKAYKALKIEKYKTIALKNYAFLKKAFLSEDGVHLYHTYKDSQVQYNAFLDDYAFLIEAILELYSITHDLSLIKEAEKLMELVLEEFYDETSNLFFYTSASQEDVPLRKREVYDNAIPSGNSVMLGNLIKMAVLSGNESYMALAVEMSSTLKQAIEKYPSSFSNWAKNLFHFSYANYEVAIVGKNAPDKVVELQQYYLPNITVMANTQMQEGFPILEGKLAKENASIFVCKEYACQLPVLEIEEAIQQIVGHNA